MIATVVLGLLAFVVVGIPIAVWLFVRWQFTPQVVMLEGVAGRQAFRHSGRLVRKRWFHTALVTALVAALISAVGMIVGLVLLIFFTGLPLWVLSGNHRRVRRAADAVRRTRHDLPLRRRSGRATHDARSSRGRAGHYLSQN